MERNEICLAMGLQMVEASGVPALIVYKDDAGKIEMGRSQFGDDQDWKELINHLLQISFAEMKRQGIDAKKTLINAINELDNMTEV